MNSQNENKQNEQKIASENETAKYMLVGAVSHLGAACVGGHYIAHVQYAFFAQSDSSEASAGQKLTTEDFRSLQEGM